MSTLGPITPLRRLCFERRMSRRAAAQKAGLSRQTLYNLESGQTPEPLTIFKLADALEMTPEALAEALGFTEALGFNGKAAA